MRSLSLINKNEILTPSNSIDLIFGLCQVFKIKLNFTFLVPASPLKVVKAEMNIPVKHHKNSTSSLINQILSAHTQSAPPPLSASELRHRLERLLAESARQKSRHSSRARSAHTNPAPSPPPVKPQTPLAPSKTKKTKTKGVVGKFKGKVSGKNMAVVERDNDIRFVKDNKPSKQSKSDKIKDRNNNKNLEKKPKEEEEIESEENQNNNADQDNNNETTTDAIPEVTAENQDLLLQPDNLRSTKVEIEVTDTLTEEECFKDPGRSLALVKEWRRRLEATRASCEHMLAQLKAFRDPPAKVLPPVIPTFPIPAVTDTAASDAASCLSIGRKIRKISTNKIVSAPVVSPA